MKTDNVFLNQISFIFILIMISFVSIKKVKAEVEETQKGMMALKLSTMKPVEDIHTLLQNKIFFLLH